MMYRRSATTTTAVTVVPSARALVTAAFGDGGRVMTPDLARCVQSPNVSVCVGATGIHRRRVLYCPTCQRRAPSVVRWGGAWYGSRSYCIACLDGWDEDGDRMARPFKRNWRVERAAYIRGLWDTAMLPAEYERWVDFDLHRVVCRVDECPTCLDDPRSAS